MTLEQLRKALEQALIRMEVLNNSCVDGENIRSFTDEESTEFKNLESRVNELKSNITRLQEIEKNKGIVSDLDTVKRSSPRVEITRSHNCDESGEYRGFRHIGEQLNALAKVQLRGERDPRLEEMRTILGGNTVIDSEGGFLVQTDFAAEIRERAFEESTIAKKCDNMNLSGAKYSENRVKDDSRATGSRWGGIQVYWASQGNTVTAFGAPEMEKFELEPQKLFGIHYATEEQLEDAAQMTSFVQKNVPREFAFVLDDAVLRGSGAGQPKGIFSAGGTISIAKETSQTADTIVRENVQKMWQAVHVPHRNSGEWYANAECEIQLEQMYIAYTTDGGTTVDGVYPMYVPTTGLTGKAYDTIRGRKLNIIEHASALGDLGDIFFADFSDYTIVRKGDLKADSSIHVQFLTGQQTYRWTMRVNGAPKRNTTITPYKGGSSTKFSSFVTLDARA